MQVAHYERNGFETVEFVEYVLRLMDCTPREAWCIGSALKYAMRAGNKAGEPWQKDARKCADFLSRYKTGYWLGDDPDASA